MNIQSFSAFGLRRPGLFLPVFFYIGLDIFEWEWTSSAASLSLILVGLIFAITLKDTFHRLYIFILLTELTTDRKGETAHYLKDTVMWSHCSVLSNLFDWTVYWCDIWKLTLFPSRGIFDKGFKGILVHTLRFKGCVFNAQKDGNL